MAQGKPEIRPVQWAVFDENGCGNGTITSWSNGGPHAFRARPSYGKQEFFETLEAAAEYVLSVNGK